jgi:hypothetical protein
MTTACQKLEASSYVHQEMLQPTSSVAMAVYENAWKRAIPGT